MNDQFIQFAYLVAAVLLIRGLSGLGSPKTAPRGNLTAAAGMLIAIVATLLMKGVVSYTVIIAGLVVGSAIGAVLALRIQMSAMPQMVALLNGFGGGASALVASAELLNYMREGSEPTGIVQVSGDRGTYYVMTEEAMKIRQYVQEGIDEADRGETTPWSASEIIQKARNISEQRSA